MVNIMIVRPEIAAEYTSLHMVLTADGSRRCNGERAERMINHSSQQYGIWEQVTCSSMGRTWSACVLQVLPAAVLKRTDPLTSVIPLIKIRKILEK